MKLKLFAACGIELEYMIVDSETLDVKPQAEVLLTMGNGTVLSELESDSISWSNELPLHLIEIKNAQPARSFTGLIEDFNEHVGRINHLLKTHDLKLLSTGMHPWMDPRRETQLWPHEHKEVYRAFDKVFGCHNHGFANLQSLHLNLPFANDHEFSRLHAAIRLLLPLLPALAASSPIVEGKSTSILDNRLEHYRNNCLKVPFVTGQVIPEPIYSANEYQEKILKRIATDMTQVDRSGILQSEWLNARGAIARFERNSIEIRLLDVQECPLADLSMTWGIFQVLKAMTEELWAPLDFQKTFAQNTLVDLLDKTIRQADETVIDAPDYLLAFGFKDQKLKAFELWQCLFETVLLPKTPTEKLFYKTLRKILSEGVLSRRILQAVKNDFSRGHLKSVYQELSRCLSEGKLFLA